MGLIRGQRGEGGHRLLVSAGVVLGPGERLQDAAGFRLGLRRPGEERGRGRRVALGEQLQATPVPLVDAALGRPLLRHALPPSSAGRPTPPLQRAFPAASGHDDDPEPHAPTIIVVLTPSESRAPSSASGLEVRPFRALTYRQRDPEHLARVSSPAYDLVTPSRP